MCNYHIVPFFNYLQCFSFACPQNGLLGLWNLPIPRLHFLLLFPSVPTTLPTSLFFKARQELCCSCSYAWNTLCPDVHVADSLICFQSSCKWHLPDEKRSSCLLPHVTPQPTMDSPIPSYTHLCFIPHNTYHLLNILYKALIDYVYFVFVFTHQNAGSLRTELLSV